MTTQPDNKENMSIWQILNPANKLGLSLFVCACIQFSQQMTGVGVLIFYSTTFFQSAGLGCELSKYATIGKQYHWFGVLF
jgi:hypothetical protein